MTPDGTTKRTVEGAGNSTVSLSAPVNGSPQGPRRSRKKLVLVAGAFVLCVAALVFLGIRSRVEADSRLKLATDQAAVPTVQVIHPKPGAPAEEIVLPGSTIAFTDTPIYARTNGYLRRWYFDIGARVKNGQLLAVIETPEVDQQLQQARADLETAQANMQLAKITSDRWQFLVKSGSVSKQETDQAVSNLAAMKAVVGSLIRGPW